MADYLPVEVGHWIVTDGYFMECCEVEKVTAKTVSYKGKYRSVRMDRDRIRFAGSEGQCLRFIELLKTERSRHEQATRQLNQQHAERVAKIIEQAKKDAA